MISWLVSLFYKLFGYCDNCGKWFVYPKRRRMSTLSFDEEFDYCCVCKSCFDQLQASFIESEYWCEYCDSVFSRRR